MFPFGFQRPTFEHLANRIDVNYFKWNNEHRDNTVFYPDILDTYGLSDREKSEILKAEKYEYTMNWAANMYFIGQDTTVDIKQLDSLVVNAVSTGLNKKLLTGK